VVQAAYGMNPKQDPLAFLLALNGSVAAREAQGQPVTAPGLPPLRNRLGAVPHDRLRDAGLNSR
jgi:hypothetical protein